ncbi:MAG: hypothetical protein K1X56_02850 [Flavobacteriales bacterium]|nr:hypothetical protein [Flavobacteriales bacterium]
MKKIISIAFLFFIHAAQSQNVIIKQDVENDFEEQEYGPNKKYYNATFTSFGLLFGAPDSTGSAVNWAKSFYYETGARHKHQFSPLFAMGHDFNLNFKSYSIKQNDEKTFGGISHHKSERLLKVDANFLIYTRFNLKKKRGNQLGRYIDLAGYVEYQLFARHMTKDKIDAQLGGSMVKSYYRDLPYLNKWNYGATVRLGFRHMLLFCQYRISDMIKPSTQFPYQELPRFCAGICFDVPTEFSRDR